ncbi:MAG: sn-glycerol-3-phosphate ABC transporter ATP-binding protein UgpC [Fibrobacter sp.]|jgi:ABC-type sugar transport system ATPase subunit|nr:sn-glycerol-3-phosphate ABC transporter ATP-binding protein UgpC [Fibrobacter sp.]
MSSLSSSVTLREVSKIYPGNKVPVVNSFSLEIQEGEFLVLVGPSGCGKSSILRMIAGLDAPSSGEILIGDTPVDRLLPKDRDIAMVFQNYALYSHMTVKENLEFGLRVRGGISAAEIEERVRETSETLELNDLLNRKPGHLSGGQKQRVALGRAFIRKPKIFLFDEPFSNLDAKMRSLMRVELGRLHSRLQSTMIFVTHDQTEAMTMGSRVACLQEGRLMQLGNPMELYRNPASEFVATFIGSPVLNLFTVKRVPNGMHIEQAKITLPVPARLENVLNAKSRIRLGIRPEFVRISVGQEISLPVVVEVVEPLGPSTLVYVRCQDLNLVTRVSVEKTCEVGDRLFMTFSEEHFYAFDISSGERIL